MPGHTIVMYTFLPSQLRAGPFPRNLPLALALSLSLALRSALPRRAAAPSAPGPRPSAGASDEGGRLLGDLHELGVGVFLVDGGEASLGRLAVELGEVLGALLDGTKKKLETFDVSIKFFSGISGRLHCRNFLPFNGSDAQSV